MSKKQLILIIEDDAWMAAHNSSVLEKAGYKTVVSHSAHEAIDIIDKKIPDAIVLDVLLPGSTGFALLHEMKSYSDTSSIPVILCTNLASEISDYDIEAYGIKRVLDKSSMEPGDLVAAARSVLL